MKWLILLILLILLIPLISAEAQYNIKSSATIISAIGGVCPAGYVVQNITSSGVPQCVLQTSGSGGINSYKNISMLNDTNNFFGDNYFETGFTTISFLRLGSSLGALIDISVDQITSDLYWIASPSSDNWFYAKRFLFNNNFIVGTSGEISTPNITISGSFYNSSGAGFSLQELNATGSGSSSSTFNATYDLTSKDVTANRSAWFSTYNATYDSNMANNSWNETRANFLYSDIKWGYNQTYSGSTYNATYHGLINNASYLTTFNTTYATWLPNFTASNKFWYNMTIAGGGSCTPTTGSICTTWAQEQTCSGSTQAWVCTGGTYTEYTCQSPNGNTCDSWAARDICQSWTSVNACTSWTTRDICTYWQSGNWCQ